MPNLYNNLINLIGESLTLYNNMELDMKVSTCAFNIRLLKVCGSPTIGRFSYPDKWQGRL